MAEHFDKTYRVRAVYKEPTSTYEDPLAQRGFVAVKITEVAVGEQPLYMDSYGKWIEFKHTADEGAVSELVSNVARELIGRHVARYVAETAFDQSKKPNPFA